MKIGKNQCGDKVTFAWINIVEIVLVCNNVLFVLILLYGYVMAANRTETLVVYLFLTSLLLGGLLFVSPIVWLILIVEKRVRVKRLWVFFGINLLTILLAYILL